MSEQMKCDQCGKAVDAAAMVNWFKVERLGLDAGALGDEKGPWHFDTSPCLEAWARARRSRTGGG